MPPSISTSGELRGGVRVGEAKIQHVIPRPAPNCGWGKGGAGGSFAEGEVALQLPGAEALMSPGVQT